jgi:hypothetical protein
LFYLTVHCRTLTQAAASTMTPPKMPATPLSSGHRTNGVVEHHVPVEYTSPLARRLLEEQLQADEAAAAAALVAAAAVAAAEEAAAAAVVVAATAERGADSTMHDDSISNSHHEHGKSSVGDSREGVEAVDGELAYSFDDLFRTVRIFRPTSTLADTWFPRMLA